MDENNEQPQKQKMNINAKILLLCTILLCVFLSGAMIFMLKYKTELTASPFNYGAQKFAEANHVSDLMCSCMLQGVDVNKDPQFFFNTTSIWVEKKSTPGSYQDFDPKQLEGLFNNSQD